MCMFPFPFSFKPIVFFCPPCNAVPTLPSSCVYYPAAVAGSISLFLHLLLRVYSSHLCCSPPPSSFASVCAFGFFNSRFSPCAISLPVAFFGGGFFVFVHSFRRNSQLIGSLVFGGYYLGWTGCLVDASRIGLGPFAVGDDLWRFPFSFFLFVLFLFLSLFRSLWFVSCLGCSSISLCNLASVPAMCPLKKSRKKKKE
ncbi:hypothetical protein DFJ73DRAFT_880847 [Zopfochytrium polystomum]|nr:hypothetical protein DFJ73DRAFT_880847 [Zopfochytrium polystomum]